MLNTNNLYLDDLRIPSTDKDWDIVRTSDQAREYVLRWGMPTYCSFDHDLGGDDTAMVFIKWLIEYDMKHNGRIIPEEFTFDIHSQNPVGVENIRGLLNNYLDFRKQLQNL